MGTVVVRSMTFFAPVKDSNFFYIDTLNILLRGRVFCLWHNCRIRPKESEEQLGLLFWMFCLAVRLYGSQAI
jgi:hypothetical protein